ncbi:DUF4124 domain-containing protein [Cellvibrio fibrivorans]|uniref:DUF4124 domain-containing protein n=1 Tax=Cellvibrio fibrivorans TaxID=126350 RepID=A0ABU1V0Z3_9GAMM|nr:DUF4124 domain-containing protein [Cellvibrio fibrivorans]MDR7091122.1 hypothetical protein [Cellvibrio fibrivorans]
MKFSHIVKLAGIALVGVMLSQQGFAKEKVYTWTDSKGTVHYGERPPKDVKATLVQTRTGHSDPTPAQIAASQPKAEPTPPAEDPRAVQAAALKNPKRCAAAKENLNILNTVARIRTTNEQGIVVPLTEEDKVQQRIATQKVIDQTCE